MRFVRLTQVLHLFLWAMLLSSPTFVHSTVSADEGQLKSVDDSSHGGAPSPWSEGDEDGDEEEETLYA